MRVAIYARCSTADQKVDLQLDELHDYALSAPLSVEVNEYGPRCLSGLGQSIGDRLRERCGGSHQ